MDRKHQLDAPDNDILKNIEQVSDHSELSTLYRKARDQWDGELVSDDEREKRRQNKNDTISFGIRKKALLIGILIPLPLMLAWLIAAALLTYITDENAPIFVIPMIFIFLIWGLISFFTYKKVFALFYMNALQAGPFIITIFTFIGFSIPIIFAITEPLHIGLGFMAALLVNAVVVVWSVLLTFPLLYLWTTPRLSGGFKLSLISLIGIALLGTTLMITFF